MPATGRMFYDPGTPSPLETALAQQVATGRSPFAASLMLGYGALRQQQTEAVNQAQAQSHMADLANDLEMARQKEIAGLVPGALASHTGVNPILSAANRALGAGMDQGAINAAGQMADLTTSAGITKDAAEVTNYGSQAGGGVADMSPLLAKLGYQPTPKTTPRDIQGHQIAANATLGAARIGADARVAAAEAKAAAGGGGPSIDLNITDPQGGISGVAKKVPFSALSPDMQAELRGKIGDTATVFGQQTQGTAKTASGDPNTVDPIIAEQTAAAVELKPGWTLFNGNGAPRDDLDANGKPKLDRDGHPIRVFLMVPPGGGTPVKVPIGKQ